jgi:hypothetical protein
VRSDRGFLEEGVDLAIETITDHPKSSAIVFIIIITILYVAN